VVNDVDLTEYARRQMVYPVSPNTLYAHLQVILQSFQGKEIEKRSHQLFALLRGIQKDYIKLSDTLGVLNKHITNSYNQMSNVNTEFLQIGQKLSSTQTLEGSEETKQLET
jgi:DNA recombination protein RmuC